MGRLAAIAAIAAPMAAAGVTLTGAPPAHADGGIGNYYSGSAWTSFDHHLMVCPPGSAPPSCFDTGLGVASGTNPAVTALPCGYAVAWQGTDGLLWYYQDLILDIQCPTDSDAGVEFGPVSLGLMPGTSPAITATGPTQYAAAFQGNVSGDLWTVTSNPTFGGLGGGVNTGLVMAPGTNPSMTTEPNGGYEVAYQDKATTSVAVYGSAGTGLLGLGMAAGTSPAITNPSGTFEPGFNPASSVAAGYQIAFQANTGHLWGAGSYYYGDTNLGLAPRP
jgi:hypothetical protein